MDQKSLAKEIRSAIKNGKIEIVENLIGVNTEAASDGHIEIVKLLLLSGAELDVSEPERNPLFGAIYGGHLDIVKLLVEHGIDIHILYNGTSMRNMDAIAFATELGQNEIADLLKKLTE